MCKTTVQCLTVRIALSIYPHVSTGVLYTAAHYIHKIGKITCVKLNQSIFCFVLFSLSALFFFPSFSGLFCSIQLVVFFSSIQSDTIDGWLALTLCLFGGYAHTISRLRSNCIHPLVLSLNFESSSSRA